MEGFKTSLCVPACVFTGDKGLRAAGRILFSLAAQQGIPIR